MWRRSLCGLVVILTLAVLLGAGCGGGGGTVSPDPPQPVASQQKFLLDFVANTVTVIEEPVSPAFVETSPGAAAAELALTLRIAPEGISQPGNLGRRHFFAKVTNRSSGFMGTTDSGGASSIELSFIATEFRNAAGAAVPGGGYAREDGFEPPLGTPIYYFLGGLAPGGTSAERQIDMWLPVGATQVVVTAILRAHCERFNPVSLDRFWVSTVAGEQGHYGWVDGTAWTALFGTHPSFQGLLFREGSADVLIAEPSYNVVRMVAGNSVTRKAEVFTVAGTGDPNYLAQPQDLAIDVLNTCWVSEYAGGCISVFTPNPVGPYKPVLTIAGVRGAPGDAVGTGATARFNHPIGLGMGYNALYVCDQNGTKLKKIMATTPGSTSPGTYTVERFPSAGIQAASDIAEDKLGNLYVADRAGRRIFRCERRRTTWTVLAGTGVQGLQDGAGNVATFDSLGPLAVDAGGILWVVDNGRLRRIKWIGGDPTASTSWRVETIPLLPRSTADGVDGVAGRTAIRGVAVTRGGVVGFMDDGALRRIDLTRD